MDEAPTLQRPAPPEPPEPLIPGLPWRPEMLAPGFLLLACAIALVPFHGGYARNDWSVVALFVLALLVLVLLVAPPRHSDRSRLVDIAVVLFGAFTLWSYASILWADVPGDAWEGANRTALFAVGFALVALRPWPARAARWALMVVVFGLAATAIVVLISTATRDDVATMFIEGRLAQPIGYANAVAALWLIGFWPAVHLAVARELAWPVRALSLGAATVLLSTSLLSQSRGSALGFVVTAIAFLLLHPRRWPAFAALAVPVATVWVGWDELTRVRQVADSAALTDALGDARRTVAIFSVLAFVLCAAACLGALRAFGAQGAPTAMRRNGDRAFLGIAAVLAVAGVVVVAGSGGWLQDRWDSFTTTNYGGVENGQSRFTGALGSGRYDFYRVALKEFADHPITGIGAENFAGPYLTERRTLEAPRYVHSLPLAILVQLGIVGAALFAGFLAALLAAIARVRRTGGPAERGLAIGALGGALGWLVHGSVDWLWEYPSLSLLALGLLAVGARAGDRVPAPPSTDERGPLRRWPVRAIVAIVVLLVAVSIALPGAAARYERKANSARETNVRAALRDMDRAAALDPLSADPLIARAVLARRIGLHDQARSNLVDALDREPRNWFAHLEVGLLDAQQRRWDAAARSFARASALNPSQQVLPDLRRMVKVRESIDPNRVEGVLSGQLSERLRPFGSE